MRRPLGRQMAQCEALDLSSNFKPKNNTAPVTYTGAVSFKIKPVVVRMILNSMLHLLDPDTKR